MVKPHCHDCSYVQGVGKGLLVEHQTQNQQALGTNPTGASVYPSERQINPTECWFMHRKHWLCLGMTERLLSGMLYHKTNN